MSDANAGRFVTHAIHLFKETSETGALSYCGLHERWEIWQAPKDGALCQFCARYIRERVADAAGNAQSAEHP